jgi:hypothetical protein
MLDKLKNPILDQTAGTGCGIDLIRNRVSLFVFIQYPETSIQHHYLRIGLKNPNFK